MSNRKLIDPWAPGIDPAVTIRYVPPLPENRSNPWTTADLHAALDKRHSRFTVGLEMDGLSFCARAIKPSVGRDWFYGRVVGSLPPENFTRLREGHGIAFKAEHVLGRKP